MQQIRLHLLQVIKLSSKVETERQERRKGQVEGIAQLAIGVTDGLKHRIFVIGRSQNFTG